jgi:hypothetical protein
MSYLLSLPAFFHLDSSPHTGRGNLLNHLNPSDNSENTASPRLPATTLHARMVRSSSSDARLQSPMLAPKRLARNFTDNLESARPPLFGTSLVASPTNDAENGPLEPLRRPPTIPAQKHIDPRMWFGYFRSTSFYQSLIIFLLF